MSKQMVVRKSKQKEVTLIINSSLTNYLDKLKQSGMYRSIVTLKKSVFLRTTTYLSKTKSAEVDKKLEHTNTHTHNKYSRRRTFNEYGDTSRQCCDLHKIIIGNTISLLLLPFFPEACQDTMGKKRGTREGREMFQFKVRVIFIPTYSMMKQSFYLLSYFATKNNDIQEYIILISSLVNMQFRHIISSF